MLTGIIPFHRVHSVSLSSFRVPVRLGRVQQNLMFRIKRSLYEGLLCKTGTMLDQFPHRDIPVLHILVDDRDKSMLVEDIQRRAGNPALLSLHDLRDVVPAHHAFVAAPRESGESPPFQYAESTLVDENGEIIGLPTASRVTHLESFDPPPETHSVAPSVSFDSCSKGFRSDVIRDNMVQVLMESLRNHNIIIPRPKKKTRATWMKMTGIVLPARPPTSCPEPAGQGGDGVLVLR